MSLSSTLSVTVSGTAPLSIAGVPFVVLSEGALWQPDVGMLVVADLHLEKGSAFAARGRGLLPPYDTAATLAALRALIQRFDPAVVALLGDSFHDSRAGERIAPADLDMLRALQRGRDWIWISGNHDPDPPRGVRGDWLPFLWLGGIVLRHQPKPGAAFGEIAGHLHPVAKVHVRGRGVRTRCVLTDGVRAVLPAFGSYAGGLNVCDRAFAPLFEAMPSAFLLGGEGVFRLPLARLSPDRG